MAITVNFHGIYSNIFFSFHFTAGVLVAVITKCLSQSIEIVPLNRELIYEYEGSVNVLAQTPWDQIHLKPPRATSWKIRGTVKLQRIDRKTLAASV